MGKIMYYDNVLISELMDGDHLEHHGVLGMKWGIRRYQSYSQVPRKSGEGGKEQGLARKKSKLEGKRASNNAKISQYKKELAKPRNAKDVAKAKKYQAKLDKVNASRITKSAMKYRTRGEDAGLLGEIQMRKKAKYEHKIAKLNMKSDKLNAKISNLEYKNLKIDKKLGKIDTKIKTNEVKKKAKDYQKQLNELDRRQAFAAKKIASYKNSYSEVSRRADKREHKGKDTSKLDSANEGRIKKADAYMADYIDAAKQEKKIRDLVRNDPDLVYRTSQTTRSGGRKQLAKRKELNKQYGKDKLSTGFYSDDYYQTSTGTKHTVKRATDKRRKSWRYGEKNQRLYNHTPIHTTYYTY